MSRPQPSISTFGLSSRRHLFTENIMKTELPANWKGPALNRYDDSIVLDEHIDIYFTKINLHTSDDIIFCRLFHTSLKDANLSWFTRLPPKSINCFDTLVTKFGAQFAMSRPHHLTSITLVNIRQEKENL